ncbi:MAG: hypothetical protein HQM16_00440 [Deltaproteobacteria bacterium]|nr:hypothetical protein [Deltaproteobacteria bacterium]
MIIVNKKTFYTGFFMAVVFVCVLVGMFMPLFEGKNAFESADDLFNSLSKGSTYYIPGVEKEVRAMGHQPITSEQKTTDTADTLKVLTTNNIQVVPSGDKISVTGNLDDIISVALGDADLMFKNDGDAIVKKYGIPEAKRVVYIWWHVLTGLEKSLEKAERFKEAAMTKKAKARGIEVAYNFFAINSQDISQKWGILLFSLIFYVCYTLWWGYAIFYLVDGVGLKLKPGMKKEA